MLAKIRKFLIDFTYPILKIINHIGLPVRKIKDSQCIGIIESVLPGDIFLTRKRFEATNVLIPGYWKHAAMFVGYRHGISKIVESVGTGVRERSFYSFATSKDEIIHIRPKFATKEEMVKAAKVACQFARDKVGYDRYHDISTKALDCAELILKAYEVAVSPKPLPFVRILKTYIGVTSVTPQDYANASGKFKVIGRY